MTPSGIIMQSSSVGATKEAIEKVLTDHGYEAEKPEAVAPVAPKPEDFENDEAFETAQEEFEKQQEAAAGEEEKDEEEQQRTPTKKPTRKQRAIDKATRDLQKELRDTKDRLAALEGKGPRRETETVKEPEPPKREKFKSDAEFEDAMFDYRYQLRRAKEAAVEAVNAVQARLRENLETYQSAVVEFKEEHDDWDDVVNQTIPIHESVYLAVMELENGPDVTYYLGKHPDYARRLAEMSPLSAAMEVGRLSSRLKTGAPDASAAGNGAPRKPKTRLPEPVKPVSTAATSSTLTSAEAARKRDFRAFKTAQRAGR
jgi:hypothetical protein